MSGAGAAVQIPAIEDFDGDTPPLQHWALARRSLTRPDEIAYYLGYAPVGTDIDELVTVAGRRWAIEECFQAAKNECGLDQYEVRRYTGWYRQTVPAWCRSPWQKSADSWRLATHPDLTSPFASTR